MTVKLRSVVQCPHCGFKVTEKMPLQTSVLHYQCEACGQFLEPHKGGCCIFCSYGSLPCPARQRQPEERDQS